jgi:hypothetical protein
VAAADIGHPTSAVLQQVVPGSKEAARTWACVGDRVEVPVEVEVPKPKGCRSRCRGFCRGLRADSLRWRQRSAQCKRCSQVLRGRAIVPRTQAGMEFAEGWLPREARHPPGEALSGRRPERLPVSNRSRTRGGIYPDQILASHFDDRISQRRGHFGATPFGEPPDLRKEIGLWSTRRE